MNYSIEQKRSVAPGVWEVDYSVWEGCACGKVKRTATIEKDGMPLMQDVVRWDKTNF